MATTTTTQTGGNYVSRRWAKVNQADFGTRLRRDYPRLGRVLPAPATDALGAVGGAWRFLGPFRYLIVAALMWALPWYMDTYGILGVDGSSGVTILFLTGVWILLAIGLNVVVGLAGLLDLGYVAFLMLGAYTTALFVESGGADQFHFAILNPWLVLPIALLVAVFAGVVLGAPTLRLRGDYLAIVTLGFHEIVRVTVNNLAITNGSRGIFAIEHPPPIDIGPFQAEFGLEAGPYWQYLLIPAILLAVIMIRHLEHSRVGRYWTAIREDEVAAAAMGVPVTRMKVMAFAIGASTSGVAGWIYASKLSYISPNNFQLLASILVLSAVVIGGLGSIAGAVLGAVLVVGLPEIVRELADGRKVLGFDVETGRIAIFGLLLIIVMIFRPGGLLAARRRRTELQEATPSDAVIVEESGDTRHDASATHATEQETSVERGRAQTSRDESERR
ncbi:MAG TPA: branched-chain amino acid ABC transporter permease [Actinomycetota bacterium]|nr:branched-chain amino acid ABC transporter permease [Actinomycetota bacterium]